MPTPIDPVLAAAVAAWAVLTVLLAVLWRRAAGRAKRLRGEAADQGRRSARLAATGADQTGRLQVIRELHDVAVHRVSAIVEQAEGARYAGAADPTAAVRAAQSIAQTGRSTLADLRRVMTLVGDGEAGEAEPALKSTRELLQLMREAGLRVEVEETGRPYDLESGAELAVHRILQEATGNALQHGGEGTTVRVGFTWTPGGLALRVEDDGIRTAVLRRGLDAEAADAALAYGVEDDLRTLVQRIEGTGIDGMRTRAQLYGGSVTVTETPGVGFAVAAVFPSIRFHNGVHGVDLRVH